MRTSARLSTAAAGLAVALSAAAAAGQSARAGKNRFGNPGFEMGRTFWHLDKAKGTEGGFAVERKAAAEGEYSAVVTVGKVAEWGVQFGQFMDAGRKGKTYTFAGLAKAVGAPVKVDLQIERHGKPYDRAARTAPATLSKEKWTELHVTFKVEKDFPQGWFAYVACRQPDCRFRVDMFRLYEGEYIPYREVAKKQAASAGVRLFDTGAASPAALPGAAVDARKGWSQLPPERTQHRFQADAALLNNRLAVVLRRKGRAAEVYSLGREGAKMRALLRPLAAAGDEALSAVRIVANTPSAAALDADFPAGGKPLTVRYRLGMGQVFLQTQPRSGATALRVEAPCRFVVLPDFFADDIVVDATTLPVDRAELPSENFLLHLLGGGEAILMAVWDKPAGDVRVELAGKGDDRVIAASEIAFGTGGSIWVAVLAGEGIWHTRDVGKSDVGRVLRLDWRMPFPAQWRVDWRRSDDLADSWEMITRGADRKFVKHGWFGSPGTIPPNRLRWTTVIGRVPYPCWIERDGRGFLQPVKSRALRFEGPAVIYPISRVSGTPLDAYTVVDIVRGTLGVGPCEYILDVEGQASQYRGRATCSNRDTLNPIYQSRRQKAKRAVIEKSLKEVMAFIRHIRGRIEQYRAFGREVEAYLAGQEQARPELAGPLGDLAKLAGAIEPAVTRRRAKIKTPAEAQAMVDEFRRTMLDYEGKDAYARCKRFTAALVEIGGNQDELVGECRWAVRVLRQRAGIAMALDPRIKAVATEIRRRSRKVLRNPAGHEGARH